MTAATLPSGERIQFVIPPAVTRGTETVLASRALDPRGPRLPNQPQPKAGVAIKVSETQNHGLEGALDHKLIKAAKDSDPSELLGAYGRAFLFRNHPYSNPVIGSESIQGWRR